jgi:dipeptidyl aminopeptidase/acylaminoacyl peptidase
MKKFILLLIFTFSVQLYSQELRALIPEDLWAMKRIGDVVLSANGKIIAFTITSYNIEDNKGQTDIWLINSDGTKLRPLKNSSVSESQPRFIPITNEISYIKGGQLWKCDLNGENDIQLTDFYPGVSDVIWSKDGSKILFTSFVYPECMSEECNKSKDEQAAKNQVNVKVIEELMYRNWDSWRGNKRSHLFVHQINSKNYIDLTLSSKSDVPPVDLGSSNDYNFSPDGKQVAYTTNKDKVIATSTNNDIFIINLSSVNQNYVPADEKISVSRGNDNQPVYSQDGKFLAFRSMSRAGFEADKYSLILYNITTGQIQNLTEKYDLSVNEILWSPDSKFIYFNASNEINESIYRIDISDGKLEMILEKHSNSNLNISPDGKTLYFKQQRSNLPFEIFSYEIASKKLSQLTFVNQEILSKIKMSEPETFWSQGAEKVKVQSILVKPPFFDENKKYPVIFLIHGGPQGHWSDDFHYRWNPQMFASKGYVVIATNPRGSTGYGQKFTDEISKDWGGKVFIDLMNSLDFAVSNFNFIDSNNLFAAGASYGGYMINWIEGHSKRFNALFCHDGVYNLESMYGTTEELWFPEWEFGGAPWESPEIYKKWSPSNYVQNFKTPMLIAHGGNDFRVPEGQAFELFTALQKMNVPSKLIYFPEENHFVTKPQNSIFWWNTIFNWFDNYKVRK